MKRKISVIIIIFVVLATLTIDVNAQEKPITFGIKAGVNMSSLRGKGIKSPREVYNPQFGIMMDWAFSDNFYMLTGLDLLKKGTKGKIAGTSHLLKHKAIYLQLPIHAGYKISLTPKTKLVFEAGPYLAYGISEKMGIEAKEAGSFGDIRLRRFDYGAGAGIGLEINKFVLKGGCDLGLANLSKSKNLKAKNLNTYLTLGVHF